MLNEAGGIEADITVTRISEDTFYIITGAAFTHYLYERVMSNDPFYMFIYNFKQFLMPFVYIRTIFGIARTRTDLLAFLCQNLPTDTNPTSVMDLDRLN